jgi:drug/metabolite transporter (DMT)-like permease
MIDINRLAPIYVVFAASLWGVDGIILRPALYNLPVPLVVFIESSIVAILLTPFYRKQWLNIKSLQSKDWLAFIGVAAFGGAIGTMTITKALFYVNFVNLSIVILIQKLQPVFAILLASLLLRERFPAVFFFWAGIAVLGAYLMTFGINLPNLNTGDKTALAALFALFAALSFALSTVLSKRALRNIDFELATYLRFSITVILMLILVSSLGNLPDIIKVSKKQVLIFLLIAFTTGGPAIFLYYYGLKRISASVATICELSFPLTAVVLEYAVRGNLLNAVQWIGVAILFFSMVRVTRIKPIAYELPSPATASREG